MDLIGRHIIFRLALPDTFVYVVDLDVDKSLGNWLVFFFICLLPLSNISRAEEAFFPSLFSFPFFLEEAHRVEVGEEAERRRPVESEGQQVLEVELRLQGPPRHGEGSQEGAALGRRTWVTQRDKLLGWET